MAPEVLRGEGADYRSDLWALGVVLYEAVSGRLPFEGRTSFETSAAIMREMPKPLGPPVPPGLWATIQRCLAKEPTQRYQRAGEVQAALEALQSAGIVSPDPATDRSGPRTTILHGVRHVHVRKGDFLCWWGRQKEHSCCARTFSVAAGKSAVLISMGTPFTRWPMTTAGANTAYGVDQSYWGTFLRSSDDFGKSWTNPQEAPIRFPADTGVSLKNIWQICLGRPEDPDALYCGVEPAALFESRDAGETWSLVRGLFDHPHRPGGCRGTGAWHCTLLSSIRQTPSACT